MVKLPTTAFGTLLTFDLHGAGKAENAFQGWAGGFSGVARTRAEVGKAGLPFFEGGIMQIHVNNPRNNARALELATGRTRMDFQAGKLCILVLILFLYIFVLLAHVGKGGNGWIEQGAFG